MDAREHRDEADRLLAKVGAYLNDADTRGGLVPGESAGCQLAVARAQAHATLAAVPVSLGVDAATIDARIRLDHALERWDSSILDIVSATDRLSPVLTAAALLEWLDERTDPMTPLEERLEQALEHDCATELDETDRANVVKAVLPVLRHAGPPPGAKGALVPDALFRLLLDLTMQADPHPWLDREDDQLKHYLDAEAEARGFDGGWVVAYHEYRLPGQQPVPGPADGLRRCTHVVSGGRECGLTLSQHADPNDHLFTEARP